MLLTFRHSCSRCALYFPIPSCRSTHTAHPVNIVPNRVNDNGRSHRQKKLGQIPTRPLVNRLATSAQQSTLCNTSTSLYHGEQVYRVRPSSEHLRTTSISRDCHLRSSFRTRAGGARKESGERWRHCIIIIKGHNTTPLSIPRLRFLRRATP